VLAVVVAAGATYQAIGSALDRRRHLAPGRMVSIGTHRLHVVSAGSGVPTVVFEAALGASSISWALVQPRIAELTGTCAYDRAGMGFSELGPEPRTAQRIVEEMHAVLEAAEVPKPYLLVGHSYGGMTCRLFAAQYPTEVAGLVLLDPADPHSWSAPSELQRRKIRAGALLARQGALVARLGIARATAVLVRLGAHRAARATAVAMSGGLLAGNTDPLIAPIDRVPAELRPVAAGFWIQPRFYQSLASQIRFMPESASQVAATSIPRKLPLTVLSAASLPAAEMEQNKLLASKSAHGRHMVVPGSGHWIQLDQPEIVIRAITEMIGKICQDYCSYHPQK
jgi:pimeloyl-ACP methyl ester carboxylesterase